MILIKDRMKKLLTIALVAVSFSVMGIKTRAEAAGWESSNGRWFFKTEEGSYIKGPAWIDNKHYYFNNDGTMATGWNKIGDTWIYTENDGSVKYGWISSAGKWYYLDNNGKLYTGLNNINGRYYYFNTGGELVRGSFFYNGTLLVTNEGGDLTADSVSKAFAKSSNAPQNFVLSNSTSNYIQKENTVSKKDDQEEDDEEDEDECKVVFKDDDGDKLKTKYVTSGDKVKMYKPYKNNNTFVEWNTKKDGSGTSYSDDEKVKIKKDMTLYAIWEKENNSSSGGNTENNGSSNDGNNNDNQTVQSWDEAVKIINYNACGYYRGRNALPYSTSIFISNDELIKYMTKGVTRPGVTVKISKFFEKRASTEDSYGMLGAWFDIEDSQLKEGASLKGNDMNMFIKKLPSNSKVELVDSGLEELVKNIQKYYDSSSLSVFESYFTNGVTLTNSSYKINFTKNQHSASKDYTGYYSYSISINDSQNNVVQSFSASKSVPKTTYSGDIQGELSWKDAVSKADKVISEINYTDTTTADDIIEQLKKDINRSNLEFTVDYKDKDTMIFVKIQDTAAGYYTNIIY